MYVHTTDIHNTNAAKHIIPFLLKRIQVKSVLDIGTGLGTWLDVFLENNINDVLGIDGAYVDKKLLSIPLKYFKEYDLRTKLDLDKQFDLVVSLEVVEHIDGKYEDIFFGNIINHGDTVLFSAAIPGQGGQNHLNEQWHQYWIDKFNSVGYKCYDIIRPHFWNTTEIEWWYRQNMFLFSKKDFMFEEFRKPMHNLVCKELFVKRLEEIKTLNESLAKAKDDLNRLKNGRTGIRAPLSALLKAFKNKRYY
ncbi:class I SAM-dependent methyltransferase [Phaeodactylibacter luteus]|uniref:Class I SAM-dependent methyltransferase n=1 Tax=Phaeodactylibacter luteus TaxID=1564516 RepID=A0A5C6RNI6_9BACT|nr:methyltransferase domain-containing protein [Phaeodactylibacter luteus]TXB63793.1 class I SAM-dependent methyltransferase [Phaeodactylibacter luteus]